jgi:hypothetical protein
MVCRLLEKMNFSLKLNLNGQKRQFNGEKQLLEVVFYNL